MNDSEFTAENKATKVCTHKYRATRSNRENKTQETGATAAIGRELTTHSDKNAHSKTITRIHNKHVLTTKCGVGGDVHLEGSSEGPEGVI